MKIQSGDDTTAGLKMNAIDKSNSNDIEGGLKDVPFMPIMGNETVKAELGNAAWKLLHTILARYPEEPTSKEQEYLEMYISSFAQVYPCGECARHFIKILDKYPPQLSSRKNAAMWGCFIHNKVNQRLQKPDYDCTTILEDYDCGCGEDFTDDGEADAAADAAAAAKKVKNADAPVDAAIRVESRERGVRG